jgi:hypothetical protein
MDALRFYHYATWSGAQVARDGYIKPFDHYARGMLPLVFATTDPRWEPSVQAASKEGYWEKCGSCPEAYAQLGIPCWRFEVALIDPIHVLNLVFTGEREPWTEFYSQMVRDGIALGGYVADWYVSMWPAAVIKREVINEVQDRTPVQTGSAVSRST